MLGSVADAGTTVVADLEAGIGTLTRLAESAVDATVVVEPTPRSIDVALRAVAVADEQRQVRVVVVANKVSGDEDRARIEDALGDLVLVVVVPDDPAVDAADRLGVSPLDHEPHAPAVEALASLADLLGPVADWPVPAPS